MENDKLVLAFTIFYTILLNVTIPIRRIILVTCSGYNKGMTQIIHYTNANYVPLILENGWVELEGTNIEKMADNNFQNCVGGYGQDLHQTWKCSKLQYKNIGRYVWFSEEDDVKCITAHKEFAKTRLTFNAEEIGAERWSDVAERLMFKSNKAKQIIRVLNGSAKQSGDDVDKWWVVKNKVSINDCLEYRQLKFDRAFKELTNKHKYGYVQKIIQMFCREQKRDWLNGN